jgi:FtsP/CotA-like multicopper oxidase with cupredoxin domain
VLHLRQGRWALLAAGLGTSAAIAVAAAIVPKVVPAAAVSMAPPPTTAQQEAGMTPGLPLAEPAALNATTPRTLRLRLVAEPMRFDISGKMVWGESYNGHYVGPTLHLVPGEHVELTLVNRLTTPTDLHFHGLNVSPSGSADNPKISVLPGHSFTYHLYIPLNQPLGTFWYHDHDMCMASETMHMTGMTASARTGTAPTAAKGCQDVETQIYDGLAGTIIVGDDRALLPRPLRHVATRTLALTDMQITGDGHIVANTPSYSILSDNPTVRLVNGQLLPVLDMRPGQTELWRIVNEGADIFYSLKLSGYKFTIVGRDGYPVSQVTRAGTLFLPPAARWDVLVTAGTRPGSTWLETLPVNTGPQGDSYPAAKLMRVRVAGRPEHPLTMPVGTLPTAAASLATAHIAANRVIRLSENAAGTKMYINGKQFNPDSSVFSTPAILGTTEQWTILNETGEMHPFHTHTDHFQVMSVNGVPRPYTGEQDVVPVSSKQHGKAGEVVIRIRFIDFTGKVMFHCHIAAHEDAGMMSYVNVIAARSARPSSRK